MKTTAATGPNPLHAGRLSTGERLGELCRLLALGLIRLRLQERRGELSDETGEFSLHNSADLSVHATPTHRRTA